jgi:Ser/Thr protein kinase RdoA (MazF antagonist)
MNPSFLQGENPIFPAAYSTLETTALAGLVSEKYGLSHVNCQFVLRGVGDTYLAETSAGRYILRAYRASHRNSAQIRAEVELLLALKRAGVSVSFPIPDLNGEPVQVIEAAEGRRHLVLFSYALGRSVPVLSPRQLQSLGREMARFHDVSAMFEPAALESATLEPGVILGPGGAGGGRWRFDPETTLFGPLAQLEPYFSEDPMGYAWLVEAAKVAEKKISGLDQSGFSSGYCQFDFLPKNFHFDGDSVTFFDFDFMGYGWLVNDIMTFWHHLTIEAILGRMTREAADEAFAVFLAAYQSCRPVSEQELEAIPYLSLGFWLFYMSFHTTHDQFYPFIQPAHLKLRLGLIQQLMTGNWSLPYPAPRV